MNRYLPIVGLIAIAFTKIGFSQAPSPSPIASASPSATAPPKRCLLSSRDVEAHTFYGTKDIVADRVPKLPVDLLDRRVFLQITESGEKTDAKLFEQQQDGSFAITQWLKGKVPGLLDEIDRAIIKNKGIDCVGEAIKNVLKRKLGAGKPAGSLAAPASPKDAFLPSVQQASGEFIKTIMIILC